MVFGQAKKRVAVQEGTAVTAVGHSNIAFVKYWGKRDQNLNLPNNSSISMTLDDNFTTTTSVLFSKKLEGDQVYINNELQQASGENATEKSMFIKVALDQMRERAAIKTNALIVSENSFKSGSSIASSDSEVATVVFALSSSLNLGLDAREMSIIARQISGSACRSLYGGIVEWEKGSSPDGSDSYAQQLVKQTYWPELIDMVVLFDQSKKVSQSHDHAMVEMGTLYPNRLPFAEDNIVRMKEAVLKKDFGTMAEVIMRDSNNMHATMMDSWPPMMYLTDLSREIIYAIEDFNEQNGRNVAAYTFDEGPNAHIITTREWDPKIRDLLAGISGIQKIVTSGMGDEPKMATKKSSSLIDEQNLKPLSRTKK